MYNQIVENIADMSDPWAAGLCVLYVYSTMELNLNAKYHSISIPV
jgi:hypothetical protein